ncbi:flagellar export chaperone FliS [Alkalihalobacillus hemicellulosilyticus]|uniref:Flagellar secretion chaperone FliS n=1 Tax=Halalkalibacter hemicellulosilyticusJCM 9152 TaxID=1236971 RepID=W4QJP2_9BACI|nr:flagellar export chaperone FliS [Halalkalibacter hemicellulosilyticus]GAE31554.1 flagellar biosynthesis protein FliS [Halalkalibacter hemicellulosilyticusJCM 9152]
MATQLQSVYKKNSMQTASPGELTLMLYNGCLKFIKQANKAIEENNVEARSHSIQRAQDIIRELMVTLKMDSEASENMMRLYDFILNRLIEANVKNDVKALHDAEELVIQFRDMWKEVIQLDRKERHGEGGKA